MINMTATIDALRSRLPELEWRLRKLNRPLSAGMLPPGLFIRRIEMSSQNCIEEIKTDLQHLNQQNSEQGALFLANKISRKINVLIRICKLDVNIATSKKSSFGITALRTRQQKIQDLQDEVVTLSQQAKALRNALVHLQELDNVSAILNAQVELGEIEKKLTQMKEALEHP